MSPAVNAPPHRYAGKGFNRAAERRDDEVYLDARRRSPSSVVIRFRNLDVMAQGADGETPTVLTAMEQLGDPLRSDALFLGERANGAAVFAVQANEAGGHDAIDLRQIGSLLADEEASLAAYARGLWHWHSTHLYCGRCGAATQSASGGHVRRCTKCEHASFPRTDPAVIVLVTNGDHCLLGRSPRFPKGIYSTLAGFVEPGESLEDTVVREIREEAGVEVVACHYRSSQPWPFPASLMLGFRATARDRSVQIDQDELEDAGWFARADLVDPDRRPVQLPRSDSISRHLIEDWLYNDD